MMMSAKFWEKNEWIHSWELGLGFCEVYERKNNYKQKDKKCN